MDFEADEDSPIIINIDNCPWYALALVFPALEALVFTLLYWASLSLFGLLEWTDSAIRAINIILNILSCVFYVIFMIKFMPRVVNLAINKKYKTKGNKEKVSALPPSVQSVMPYPSYRCCLHNILPIVQFQNQCLCSDKRWLVYLFSFITSIIASGIVVVVLVTVLPYFMNFGHN